MVLDLSQDIDDLLWFRTQIFLNESPVPIIYSAADYETDTIDLTHPARS